MGVNDASSNRRSLLKSHLSLTEMNHQHLLIETAWSITWSAENGGRYSPCLVADFRVFPFVPGAVEHIKEAWCLVFIVTIQPDVSQDFLKLAVLDEMHQKLNSHCRVDVIYICHHDDFDTCSCRKKLPGRLIQAATDLAIDLVDSWMFGDCITKIQVKFTAGL